MRKLILENFLPKIVMVKESFELVIHPMEADDLAADFKLIQIFLEEIDSAVAMHFLYVGGKIGYRLPSCLLKQSLKRKRVVNITIGILILTVANI